MNLSGVDITSLTALINQIQSLLDSDPETPGFQTGANIVTMLGELGARITALETLGVQNQIDALYTLLNTANEALNSEVIRAQAAEANLQNLIDGLNSQIVTLVAQVQDLQNNSTAACDCAAIASQIADLQTSVSNLEATDAAQALQIAALQANQTTVAGQIVALQTAVDAATATANQALTAANSANASVSTLAATVSALDAREAANAAAATAGLAAINARLGSWDNLCVNGIAAFSTALTNAANGYN